jgi:hypothetical protein
MLFHHHMHGILNVLRIYEKHDKIEYKKYDSELDTK